MKSDNIKAILNKDCKDNLMVDLYIKLIEDNKSTKRKIYKTARHHILPRSLYPEYENLSLNKWNEVILSHSDHLYAHYLLSYIFGGSMSRAFYFMCNLDTETFSLNEKMYKEQYEKSMIEHLKYFSENNPARTESHINRMKFNNPMSNPEISAKVANKLKGKKTGTRSDETKQKHRLNKLGANNPNYGKTGCFDHLNKNMVKCDHCDVISTIGNITRWHNANCKLKNSM